MLIAVVIASFSNAIALLVRQQEALIGISQFIVLPLQFLSSAVMDTRSVPGVGAPRRALQPGRLGDDGLTLGAVGLAPTGVRSCRGSVSLLALAVRHGLARDPRVPHLPALGLLSAARIQRGVSRAVARSGGDGGRAEQRLEVAHQRRRRGDDPAVEDDPGLFVPVSCRCTSVVPGMRGQHVLEPADQRRRAAGRLDATTTGPRGASVGVEHGQVATRSA